MIPCLDGSLPEELTQKLIHNLLIDRKVDDSVLQRLLDFNIRNLDLEGTSKYTRNTPYSHFFLQVAQLLLIYLFVILLVLVIN